MRSILAIDAAWTGTEPSGVALLTDRKGHWECVALAPSYRAFLGLAAGIPVNWALAPVGDAPNPEALLSASQMLLGGDRRPDIVTVDMPVATVPIMDRREADDAVARVFGGAGCGTHSPNADRPGPIGRVVSDGFGLAGFDLATANTPAATSGCLVEVYPHPALLVLCEVEYRVPYKVGKSLTYWPDTTVPTRIGRLLTVYGRILNCLQDQIANIPLTLPAADDVRTLDSLKRYEDALDALVCGWVGIRYLTAEITHFGDTTAAIWTPSLIQGY